MGDDRYRKGMAVRKFVLGKKHVEQAEADKTGFDDDFQRFITEAAWGFVWAREGLDRKTRHMLTIAILAALGRQEELALHINATENTGVTRQDVEEILLQVAVYAGIPAANAAVTIAKKVYAKIDNQPS